MEHGGVRLPSLHMRGRPPRGYVLMCASWDTPPRRLHPCSVFGTAGLRGQASRVNPLAPARGGRVRACMLLCCPGSGFPCHSFCRLLVAVSGCASPRPPAEMNALHVCGVEMNGLVRPGAVAGGLRFLWLGFLVPGVAWLCLSSWLTVKVRDG